MRDGDGVSQVHGRLAEVANQEMIRDAIDILSRATGFPVQIRDSQGFPLPGDDDAPTFCSLIRSCRGLDLCRKRAIAHCPRTVGTVATYTTHSGFLHLVAPICIEKERVGIVVIGPVLNPPCPDDAICKRAQLLGLPEDRLIEASRSIHSVSGIKTEDVAKLLSPLSVFLSDQVARQAKSLERELERQRGVEEITMLRRIVDIINSGLDVGRTLRSIAEFAMQMTGSDVAIIRLREGDNLVCKANVGLKRENCKFASIPVGRGLTGRVVTEGVPVSSVDVQHSEEVFLARSLVREHLHGYLSVPIKVRGKVVGVLTTFRRKRYRYSLDDMKRLNLLANETAMAVDNALLFEERVRAEKRASLLAEAGKIFSSSLDIDNVLQAVTEKISLSLDVLCTISLASEDGRLLVRKASFHSNPAKIDLLKKLNDESPVWPGVGLIGRAFEKGELVFVDGGGPESFPDPDRPYFRAINMTSAVAVPLRTQDRVAGVLVVAIVDSDRRFEEGDVMLVENLAERAAIALENARLYRRAEAERIRLEAVISGMVDGVVVLDKDGKVSAINRAGWEILGKHWELNRGDETDPEPLPYHDGHSPILEKLPLTKVLAEGASLINAETTFRRIDGQQRVCQISAAPVRDHQNAITGAVAVFRDVTSLKEVERLKDELISVVSHEFRAPLTAISGYTQMLIRQLSRRENVERELGEANLVLSYTERLAGMVRDLLDISRLESGHFLLKRRITMLPTLIKSVTDRHNSLSIGHTITVRAPKDFPPMYVDPERVEQILDNLIGNAVKYSPHGGKVLVTVKLHGDGVVISVRDWGIGIDQKYLPNLFERFYRVDNRESREFEGIGLGLHVAKLLVEAHNGRISVTSRKGQGSTFSFSLPFIGGDGE